MRGCFNPRKTKRIISFTLYKMPDNPEPRSVDTVGILQNLRLMRLIYPGWRMRIMIRSVTHLNSSPESSGLVT